MRATVAVSIISVILAIFVGVFFDRFFKQLAHTTFAHRAVLFTILFVLLFILNSVAFSAILSLTTETVQESEMRAMDWAYLNTPVESTFFAPVRIGNLIAAVAARKNVVDETYLFAPSADERMQKILWTYAIESSYLSSSNSMRDMYLYAAEYLYLPFGFDDTAFQRDTACFELVYNKEVKIYKRICRPLR